MYSKIVHIVTDHQYRNTTEIQRRATPETSEGHICQSVECRRKYQLPTRNIQVVFMKICIVIM